jgi:hypothetical protein
MCLILTKIGYAHDFKFLKLQHWLKSDNYFDPRQIGQSIERGVPLRLTTTQELKTGEPRSMPISASHPWIQYLSEQLKNIEMSDEGVNIIVKMVCMGNATYRLMYQSLSMSDKL